MKEVTESEKDEVVFGANVPRPPRAKLLKTIAPATAGGAETVNAFTTFYDPSKADAIAMSGNGLDWTHTKNGRYTAR